MTQTHTQGRFRALFLLGTAHCGSTLLGRMLGMHSRVLMVGEIMRMEAALERGFVCSCGAEFERCESWGPRMELLGRYGNDYLRYDLSLFDELAQRSGKDLVFDTSKTRVWRSRRNWSKGGASGARGRTGFVLLLRDSRGVLAAAKRDGHDVAHVASRHAKWIQRLTRFAAKESERSVVMTYEGLCRAPEPEMRRLLEFLELPWQDAIMRPADVTHHLVHASASKWLPGSNEVRRDERWRTELRAGEQALVEKEMRRVTLLSELYLNESSARYAYRT